MKYPEARILVMTKAPEPGQVKRRLTPLLGDAGAAAFYKDLVEIFLARVVESELSPVELWCSPSTDHSWFRQCGMRHRLPLHEQSRGDLGKKMDFAITSALQRTEYCILIGGDCPAITQDDIDEALSVLDKGKEAVIGPAKDGGYYLIGSRRPIPEIFSGMEWSTPRVFSETIRRFHAAGIDWHCLSARPDIDTAADYQRFIAHTRQGQNREGR